MSDSRNQELTLSAHGRIRREEILTHVLRESSARQIRRRRLLAATMVVIGLAMGRIAWTQFGDTQGPSHAPPARRVSHAESSSDASDLRYPHLDVEIVRNGEPLHSSSGHHAIALEKISDEQLISQLADKQLPFGLLIADGEMRLLPHAPGPYSHVEGF